MKYLPEINIGKTKATTIDAFQGYNAKNPKENQFITTKNMSADDYPVLSTRKERSYQTTNGKEIYGTVAVGDDLYSAVEGDYTSLLYKNGEVVANDDGSAVIGGISRTEKQMLLMGAEIIILPDKISINTETNEVKWLNTGRQVSNPKNNCLVIPCMIDTSSEEVIQYIEIDNQRLITAKPEEPKDGDIWLDAGVEPRVFKEYFESSASWAEITMYTEFKIAKEAVSGDICELFKEGDYISIDASIISGNEYDKEFLNMLAEKTYKLLYITSDEEYVSIVFDMNCLKYTQYDNPWFELEKEYPNGNLYFKKEMPDMDYFTVAMNRLWGCSSEKHEIYACKLGDFSNWESYAGIASDSYAATIGSPGDFTGACTYNDSPIFFKENRIITVYGTRPSNYQINDMEADGIMKGSNKSVAIIDGSIYYQSRRGIMRYSGDYPTLVSEQWGDKKYKDGVAGNLNSKYYISTKDQEDKSHLFVYDTKNRVWYREDDLKCLSLEEVKSNIYAISNDKIICLDGDNKDKAIGTSEVMQEDNVEFGFETGDLLEVVTNRQFIVRMYLNFELLGKVEMYIKYDNEKVWNPFFRKTTTSKEVLRANVFPRRCKKIQLKVIGKGEFKLYDITRVTKNGGRI